jgi:hypothetical protein
MNFLTLRFPEDLVMRADFNLKVEQLEDALAEADRTIQRLEDYALDRDDLDVRLRELYHKRVEELTRAEDWANRWKRIAWRLRRRAASEAKE